MRKTNIVKKQAQDYGKSLSSIVRLQEQSKWGEGVVEKLSQDLRMKYPKQSGYSARNLWDCKRFYLTYQDFPKLRPLVAEVSWTN